MHGRVPLAVLLIVAAGCAAPVVDVPDEAPVVATPTVEEAIVGGGGATLQHNVDGIARGTSGTRSGPQFDVPADARNATVTGTIEYECENDCIMSFYLWRSQGGHHYVAGPSPLELAFVDVLAGDYWFEARPRGQAMDDALAVELAWTVDAVLAHDVVELQDGPNRPS